MLYKTLIRPVLTYASETWVLSKTNERQLAVFERKILRKIYGPLMREEYGVGDTIKNCMISTETLTSYK